MPKSVPKVLLNGTVIRRGGGVQACAAFVRQLVEAGELDGWHLGLSSVVVSELAGLGVALPKDRISVFDTSPARSAAARRRFLGLERSFCPDMVFTAFGPAYVRFRHPHLCGVADGWVTHGDGLAYSTLNARWARLSMRALCAYKAHWLRWADEWVVEAEVARTGLAGRLGVSPDRIHLIPNSCAPHYLTSGQVAPLLPSSSGMRFLCFSDDYPNKNLSLVPEVARRLRTQLGSHRFEFVLTLPRGGAGERRILDSARVLGVADLLRNLGPIPLGSGPALYRSCDLLFHPSLLETFPATYPESMAMGVPIVTSDLPFARAVCGDAAHYFAPGNSKAAAEAIAAVASNGALRTRLLVAGGQRLRSLGLPGEKQSRLLDLVRGFAVRRGAIQ